MTEEEKKAAEANALATAQEEAKKKAKADAKANEAEDFEAKVATLEAEKATILERETNYKLAYLKEKKKNEGNDLEESDDDRIRRITNETIAESRLAEIAREQDTIIKKALKENKELKLAFQNKIPDKPSGGSHSENIEVTSKILTSEQLANLKARGWSDKDIERYKKNFQKNSR